MVNKISDLDYYRLILIFKQDASFIDPIMMNNLYKNAGYYFTNIQANEILNIFKKVDDINTHNIRIETMKKLFVIQNDH